MFFLKFLAGLEAQMLKNCFNIRIEDGRYRCLECGAFAYINKGASDLTFTRLSGQLAYDGKDYHLHGRKSTAGSRDLRSFELLSQREREVVMLLLRGQGMMDIGRSLSISPSTASALKDRAFARLNARSVIELSRRPVLG